MYTRHAEKILKSWSKKFPVVVVVGPRQSGKSTLCRKIFPKEKMINLEDLALRRIASEDPQALFPDKTARYIIDEVQRVPHILSLIQILVDDPKRSNTFILTGSNHLLLMQKVTQSLAGRVAILKLLPLSHREILAGVPKLAKKRSLHETLLQGGYPRIYKENFSASEWIPPYITSYIERDVRDLLNIGDLDSFQKFLSLCAGRAGQLLNLSSLAVDAGISQPTAKSWLSILQTSFVAFTVKPHHKNFSKRLIKSPKLYFYDTAILCSLLRIQDADTLALHPMRGAIFENWILSETLKSFFNQGKEAPLYFWRDVQGHEVDMLLEEALSLHPVEIKASTTFWPEFVKGLEYFQALQKNKNTKKLGTVIYAGKDSFDFKGYKIIPWHLYDGSP